jgi:hypothetical protein
VPLATRRAGTARFWIHGNDGLWRILPAGNSAFPVSKAVTPYIGSWRILSEKALRALPWGRSYQVIPNSSAPMPSIGNVTQEHCSKFAKMSGLRGFFNRIGAFSPW